MGAVTHRFCYKLSSLLGRVFDPPLFADEVASLSLQLDDAREKISVAERAEKHTFEKMEEFRIRIETERKGKFEYEQLLHQCKGDLENLRSEISAAHATNASCADIAAALRKENSDLDACVADLKAQVFNLTDRLQQVQQEHKNCNQTIAALKNDQDRLQRDKQGLEEIGNELQKQICELEQQRGKLEEQRVENEVDLKELRSLLQQLRKENTAELRRSAELGNEVDKLKRVNDLQAVKLADAQKEADQHTTCEENLRALRQQVKEAKWAASDEVGLLERQLKEAKWAAADEVAVLEKEVKKYKDALEEAHASAKKRQSAIENEHEEEKMSLTKDHEDEKMRLTLDLKRSKEALEQALAEAKMKLTKDHEEEKMRLTLDLKRSKEALEQALASLQEQEASSFKKSEEGTPAVASEQEREEEKSENENESQSEESKRDVSCGGLDEGSRHTNGSKMAKQQDGVHTKRGLQKSAVDLKPVLQRAERRLRAKEHEVYALKEQVESEKSKNLQSTELIESLRQQIVALQEICNDDVRREMEREKSRWQEVIEQVEAQRDAEVKQAKDALAAAEIIADLNQQTNEELQRQIDDEKGKYEGLRGLVDSERSKYEELQGLLNGERSKQLQMDNVIAGLRSELVQHSKCADRTADLNMEISDLKRAIEDLKQDGRCRQSSTSDHDKDEIESAGKAQVQRTSGVLGELLGAVAIPSVPLPNFLSEGAVRLPRRCLELIANIKKRVDTNPLVPHRPVIQAGELLSTVTTIGMNLDADFRVLSVLIGGPAFDSQAFEEGDTIVAIDGQTLQQQGRKLSAAELLKGNDSVGSPCTVTIQKRKDRSVSSVSLTRIDNNLLAHARKMADLFRRAGERFKRGKVPSDVCQFVFSLANLFLGMPICF